MENNVKSKNLKILVVEDDVFLGNAYKLKLEKAGYTVDIATDGFKAMESLKKQIPSIVLLDLIMPNMDGFSTLEAIRKRPELDKTPIIIASNLGQKEDIDKGLRLGAADYIVKSDLSMKDLIKKVEDTINKSS